MISPEGKFISYSEVDEILSILLQAKHFIKQLKVETE